jgi:lipid-A-disaccharide synthase-like uncharacterized protein
MFLVCRIIAAIGLVLISYAVLVKKARLRNELFVVGGIFLLIYSWKLRDPIFIPLQIVFIVSSLYAIYTLRKEKTIKQRNDITI